MYVYDASAKSIVSIESRIAGLAIGHLVVRKEEIRCGASVDFGLDTRSIA